MSIFAELKAARALRDWLDAKGSDFPWRPLKFPNGSPFFQLAVPEPYVAMVVPTRKSYVLLVGDLLPSSGVREFPLGAWASDLGQVFMSLLTILLFVARKYKEEGDEEGAYFFGCSVMAGARSLNDIDLLVITVVQIVAPYHRNTGDVNGAYHLLESVRKDYGASQSDESLVVIDEELRITRSMFQ